MGSDLLRAFGSLSPGGMLLVALLVGCFMRVVMIIVSRAYRTIMVCARGWPPPHLDADGDWKPEPETPDAA